MWKTMLKMLTSVFFFLYFPKKTCVKSAENVFNIYVERKTMAKFSLFRPNRRTALAAKIKMCYYNKSGSFCKYSPKGKIYNGK